MTSSTKKDQLGRSAVVTPDQVEKLKVNLASLPHAELVRVAQELQALEAGLQQRGPKTDDELWHWIKDNIGMEIPRVSVCEDHVAPFTFFADAYFERVSSAIVMANRGGSKTFSVALLHLINSLFKPGCESCTVGAIEAQALRAYAHLQTLIRMNPKFEEAVDQSIMRETRWKNRSRVEVLPGTISAVNGPHPQKVHFDEVELADEEVFNESRNMSLSKNGIAAQDLITSTRKRGHGPMQRLLDEVNEAIAEGHKPPYQTYTWCIFESAQNQPNCRSAPENSGRPDSELCECNKVVKARWDDGTARKLDSVCAGRLYKAQGWIPIEDVQKVFMADTRDVWEAQQECIKPSTEGMVLPRWRPERTVIRDFTPDPSNGPIYAGIDFGGTNPHAVVWFQLLRYEVEVRGVRAPVMRLPEGAIVVFDEFYKAEIGNGKLADAIVHKEAYWRQQHPDFKVLRYFPDPQGKAARLDLLHNKPSIKTSYYITRDVKEHIKVIVNLIDDDLLYVDQRCKTWQEEALAWHYPKKKPGMMDDPDKPVEDFDHLMAASRYGFCNTLWMHKRARSLSGASSLMKQGISQVHTSTPPAGAGGHRFTTATPEYSGLPFRDAIKP